MKDVLDTADMPTGYNSPIWQGHRPRADAAPVAWARAAGAAVLGKTVTTEFATRTPARPRTRTTPGTRRAGRAAGRRLASRAGYFPFAYGTQTAGSVIRPAAYCGVVGYKPSYGMIERHGMKLMAFSLDTVGVMARSVADCALLAGAVSGRELGDPERALPSGAADWALPLAGLARRRTRRPRRLLVEAGETLRRAGLPWWTTTTCRPVTARCMTRTRSVMQAESARSMGWEMLFHRDEAQPGAAGTAGVGAGPDGGRAGLGARDLLRLAARIPRPMAGYDVLLTPSAPGEAPAGIGWTGRRRRST